MAADDLHAHGSDASGASEGDDLFDFDELIEQSEEVADQLTAELDEALGEMTPAPEAAPAPEPVAPAAAEITPLGFRDPFWPEPDAEPELPEAHADVPSRAARGLRSQAVVIALVVLGLANLSLVGLTWKSLDTTRELVANAGMPRVGAAGPAESGSTSSRDPIDFPRSALGGPDPEGRAALRAAERALEAGEFVDARRAMYGLLAVIDRIPQAEREDVEARATFLVAETYRLQARHADGEVTR